METVSFQRIGDRVATHIIAACEDTDIRRRILLRDGYTCQGCGVVRMDNEVDHRVPLEQGGTNDDDNLQTLCGGPDGCHTRKSKEEAKNRAG